MMFIIFTVLIVCLASLVPNTNAACVPASADLCLSKFLLDVQQGPINNLVNLNGSMTTAASTLDACIIAAQCSTEATYTAKVTSYKKLPTALNTMTSTSATVVCSLLSPFVTCYNSLLSANGNTPPTDISQTPASLDQLRIAALSGGSMCTANLDYSSMASCLTRELGTITTTCITPYVDSGLGFTAADVDALVKSILLNFHDAETARAMVSNSCSSACSNYAGRLITVNGCTSQYYNAALAVTPTSTDGQEYCPALNGFLYCIQPISLTCVSLISPVIINPSVISMAADCGVTFADASSIYLHGASIVFALVSALFFLINRYV